MAYHSHPLEGEGVDVIFTPGLASSRPASPKASQRPVNEGLRSHESPMHTIHLLHECLECMSYTKHVDRTISLNPAARHALNNASFLGGIEAGRRLQMKEDSVDFSRSLNMEHRRQEELLVSRERYRRRAEGLEKEVMGLRDRLMAMQMAYDDYIRDGLRSSDAAAWTYRRPVYQQRVSSYQQDEEVNQRRMFEYTDDDDEDFDLMQQLHLMNEQKRHDETHSLNDIHNGENSDSDSEGYDTPSSSSESSLGLKSSSDTPLSEDSETDVTHDALSSPPIETELSIGELSTLIEAAQEDGNADAVDEVRLLVQDAQRTPRGRRTSAQTYLLLTWRTPTWIMHPTPAPSSTAQLTPAAARAHSAGSGETLEVFVDASSWGVGLVINQRWLAWKFARRHPAIPFDQKRVVIMSWAELIALELGVLTLIAAGHQNMKVTIRSDNLGVVNAVREQRWTPHYGLDGMLQRVLALCEAANLDLQVKWVSTKVNPADKPSRGVFPPQALVFPHAPSLPEHLAGFLKQVIPA